ncbi:MAG: GAF domain-containing protein [Candidatus Nealsonbacteria bacterium]|nr:GAF domain-containing protein [Candidatus Nealsonbacteria bacterium]
MNFYALTALINAVAASIFGSTVFFKNSRRTINQTFGLFCFFVAIWSYSYFFWQIATVEKSALFWSRALMVGAVFISTAYFHFILVLLNKIREKKKTLIFGYFIFFLFFLANFTPFFIKGVEPKLNFAFWPVAGSLYLPFLVIWFFYAFYAIYLLLKAHSASTGITKNQLRYILFGTIVGYFGGATNYPLWFDVPIAPVGNWTFLFYLGIVAYSILKYRLMDIRFVLGRGVIYALSFATVILFAFSLTFLNNRFFDDVPDNISMSLILVISVVFFQPTFRLFEKFASEYFYYSFYSYQKVLTDLGKKLTQVLELDRLSDLLVETLMNTLKLDRAVILLRSESGAYQIQSNIGFRTDNGISLIKDDFLTWWLERNQKPLVHEEISLLVRDTLDEEEKAGLEKLKENLKKIEAALCLPLLLEGKLSGMIVLGNKISGDPYSDEDLNLLTTLSSQASIALQNAKLYSETKGFSKKLEGEVEKRTKELQDAYEELKKLDKAKSEFLSIASHQLRTPLTAVKGYISMILEKSYGAVPEKIEKPLKNVSLSNERLIKLVNDLLSISRIEAGRIEMNFEKLEKIEELIASVMEELKNVAEEKDLYLKFEKPKPALPPIMIDKEKLRQVILNLIDNAIRYTQKGGVTIRAEMLKGQNLLRIEVSDTGAGMTEEELAKMFESFSRGTAGARLYTEGAGLGLYIARKFVEMHRGRIWAESKGKKQGSTFFVELPAGR